MRPNSGTYGSENGSDWDNAYDGLTDISWASLSAGDTIWVAGGAYSGQIFVAKSGSDGLPITIKRATADDSECTTATGWSAAYDAQVVITQDNAIVNSQADINYITIDGNVADGIKIIQGDGSGEACINWPHHGDHWTVQYVHFQGPGDSDGYSFSGRVGAVDLTPSATQGDSTYFTLSNCTIHGFSTALYFLRFNYVTVEYNTIYDNISDSAEHENIMYISGNSNYGTIRYNNIYNYTAEGIYFSGPDEKDVTDWKIYGNIFRDGVGLARVFEVDLQKYATGSVSNLYFYNNTINNMWLGIRAGAEQTLNGWVYNNIFYNVSSTNWNNLVHDYNYTDGNFSEANGIASGSDPFEDLSGDDYHLASGSTAINAGTPLDSEYNTDMDGEVRGQSGWDIGAYEYSEETPANTIQGVTIGNIKITEYIAYHREDGLR